MRWWNNWRNRLILVTGLLSMALVLSMGLGGGNYASAGLPASVAAGATTAGSGGITAASAAAFDKTAPSVPVSCADISRLGIDKQMNIRAAQILAACAGGAGKSSPGQNSKAGNGGNASTGQNSPPDLGKKFVSPFVLGTTDVDVVTPDGTYPSTVQSEDMTWAHGNVVVTNYNDSRAASSSCFAGLSYSLDGGSTWIRPNPSPLCSGHGSNSGDPILVWNNALNAWYAGDLASGCGGFGLGSWSSPDGINWSASACIHNGSNDDRESMWVDNNVASPHYGRMYVSLNDFNVGSGALEVVYSDNGTSWSAPIVVSNGSTFMRDVQITGDLLGSGNVYIAGMDEGGGGLTVRQNHIFRSTDGGLTWTDNVAGPSFQGPGRSTSGYFALVFSSIWRHMGWGQPAAVGTTVHYVYTACGTNVVCSGATDHGDIYYIRSTDSGTTWSAPLKLNSDTGTAMQWQPSLAATTSGAVYAGWYDQREVNGGSDLNCTAGSTSQPCYRRYGRLSLNNGATWQADDQVGDVNSPLPAQPDGNIQPTYEGDYNYISADGNTVYDHWTDGRVALSGTAQQDIFLDRINAIVGTPTPTNTPCSPVPCTNTPTSTPTFTLTPTQTPCGNAANYQYITTTLGLMPGGTDTGNHTDDGLTAITLPFALTLYGQTYTTAQVSSNGQMDFAAGDSNYSNACLPDTVASFAIFPHWDDQRTDQTGSCTSYGGVGCGIFTGVSGSPGSRTYVVEWRAVYYANTAQLAHYEIIFYENNPNRFDVVYGQIDQNGTSATVGVQRDTGSLFTQFECNTGGLFNGLDITFFQNTCGTLTPTPTGTLPTSTPTRTFTNTPTVTLTPTNTATATFTLTPSPTSTAAPCGTGSNYQVITGTLALVPGTQDIGNHTDDGTTAITLPFTYNLYGQPFTSANVSSNGTFQFTSNNATYSNTCLPTTTFNNTIFPFWDDLYTVDTANGEGVFTSVSGSAPNRIFNIEWRAVYCCTGGTPVVNFEIRLYEGQNKFDVIYGTTMQDRASSTVGVQRDTGSLFTQVICNTAISPNTSYTFYQPDCGTPTFTPTGTPATNTPTNTSTRTPSPTATVCGNYSVATASATIDPGINDIGNHTDDGDTLINLPFSYQLYNSSYSTANVSSNGRLEFVTVNDPGGYTNACLPAPANLGPYDYTIFPNWDDQLTTSAPYGVFTSVVGVAPNRIFNIEWRSCLYNAGSCGGDVNYEVRLYEGQQRFDVIYGNMTNTGTSATVGVQGPTGFVTQYECNTGGLTSGLELIFTLSGCGTATPTPTNTPAANILVGHVTYQGISQPSTRNQQPITLTLCVGGSSQNFVTSTDTSAHFTVTLALPAGNYNYKVKDYKNLSNGGTLTLNSGTTNVEFGTLRAGDANNNDVVNTTDFTLLKNAFGTSNNLNTDFNNDGITNTTDFTLLKGNFGLVGQGITCP